MSGPEPSGDNAAFCAELVRNHDFARYASTLFVPAATRRALLALYAFNVEINRVRDSVTQPLPGEIRLQWWADVLAGRGHGGVEGNPVAAELLRAISEFRLPVEPLSRLIAEHEFDLYNDPMPTMAALEGYLNETSSTLFAQAARIVASPSGDIDYLARHAGLAHGLTRVIANLPRDASRRQLFLPQEVLKSQGSSPEEVFAGRETPKLRTALDHLFTAAQRHLKAAFALLVDVRADVRPVFLPLALVRHDLARMSRADNDPFKPQMTSRFRVLWTLWRAARQKEFS
jgi:15-cis-phytoene synthase